MTQTPDVEVKLLSFGHSFGVPKNTDLLYSVRYFPATNVDNYQQYDGQHKRIQNELLHLTEYEEILHTIIERVRNFLLEHHRKSLTVAVGCEQGRHRSVAVVERLGELLGPNYNVEIHHRDLQKVKSAKKEKRDRTKNRDAKYCDDSEDT